MEWGAQKAAHDVVVSLKIAVGRRLRMSRDFLHHRADIEASKDWCELFKDPTYHGHSFLDLKNSKDKPIQPRPIKAGPGFLTPRWVLPPSRGSAGASLATRPWGRIASALTSVVASTVHVASGMASWRQGPMLCIRAPAGRTPIHGPHWTLFQL
jgi:hypothetical protein